MRQPSRQQPKLLAGKLRHPSHRPRFSPRSNETRTTIHIPIRTLATLTLWVAGVWFFSTLSALVLQLIIGFMLASAFAPLVGWLEKRGASKGGAVALIGLVLVMAIGLFLIVLIPAIIEQASRLSDNLPGYVDQLGDLLRRFSPDLYEQLQESSNSQEEANLEEFIVSIVDIGTSVVRAIVIALSIAAFSVYLLLDGNRIYTWLTGELPEPNRTRARMAITAAGQVVSSYVRGQALASLLFGSFAFIVLTFAGVPEALLLAILAAFLDAVPLIGPVIATIPAALLALTVSPETAILVLALYLIYQQIENFVIVPRVFRSTLQLHPFAVLIAVLVGTQLLGVIGALLALPISAIIPMTVRIWRSMPSPVARRDVQIKQRDVVARSSIYRVRTRRTS